MIYHSGVLISCINISSKNFVFVNGVFVDKIIFYSDQSNTF